MKVIKQYQCEYCNSIFNQKNQALGCEDNCINKQMLERNYVNSLKQYYTPLGQSQITLNEAYHIKHGGDRGLLKDIVTLGLNIFSIEGISNEYRDSKEIILEVKEAYDSEFGLNIDVQVYTKIEWIDRVNELLPKDKEER